MMKTASQVLGILDAGAQYGKLIDRGVRENNVEAELLPMDTPASILKKNYRALIISGGPESVYGANAPKYDPKIFDLDIPILGICYGMQLLNYAQRGKVEHLPRREDGPATVIIKTDSPLFKGLKQTQDVLLSHGDTVTKLAPGYRVIAMSGDLIAGIENRKKQFYGVQFHPEVDLTKNGRQILRNFLYEIAKFDGSYTLEDREIKAIDYIKSKIGNSQALVLVSGGVDSTTAAALVTKAIGKDKVHALHVDNGFMRHNESSLVKAALEKFGLNLRIFEAQDQFLNATTKIDGQQTPPLKECIEPEQKRKIIGDTFMRVAGQALSEMNIPEDDVFLVQGSLRPDLIESASTALRSSKKADTIKTHHNDTQLVRELRDKGKIIEPLGDYHKYEVRELAASLGLPPEIVWRQPFPGPGLCIRILCADKPYITKDFDQINQKLKEFEKGKYQATLLPIRTVGVQGDSRTYSYLAGLSGGEPNWPELIKIAREIPKMIHNVNRIAYIFGEAVRGPITEITPTRVTVETLNQLRQADAIVNAILLDHNLIQSISQVPVVLFPVPFGTPGNRSIGIRTMITRDFMTGIPALPGKELPIAVLQQMVDLILKEVSGISRVVYDLTSKPPGTTEWE